jgi:hypothetical protein
VRRRNGAAPGTDHAVTGGRKITTPFEKRRSSSRRRPEKQAQFGRTDGKVALGTVEVIGGARVGYWRRACDLSVFRVLRERLVAVFLSDAFNDLQPATLLQPQCLICTDPISMARMIRPECWGSGSVNLPFTVQPKRGTRRVIPSTMAPVATARDRSATGEVKPSGDPP